MKKYELRKDDTTQILGRTLYRIHALKDFNDVKAGDLGGYIETEGNLSQDDNCWIYSNAQVFDSVKIRDNARISGRATNKALNS